MTTIITADMLDGACSSQRELFTRLFPNGSPSARKATLDAAREYADKFDWDWASGNFLRAAARAEYNKATAPALAEYDKARAAAFVHAWFNQQETTT